MHPSIQPLQPRLDFSNLDNCLDNCLDNSTIYHGTLGGHTVNVFCVSSSSNRSQYVFRGDNQSATILSRHSHYSSTTSSWGEWSDLAPIGNTNNLVDGAVTNGKLAQEVKDTAEKLGLDKIFLDAGFEWRLPGCSMCLAMNSDKVPSGERCASTSNRNFEGRQGRGSRTHLVSPAMAAAAAIAGHLVDVRNF